MWFLSVCKMQTFWMVYNCTRFTKKNEHVMYMLVRQKIISVFWFPHAFPQTCVSAFLFIFIYLFIFCYETMSNCSKNCWIDWNSAMLFFKQLFHIGVWTFAWFVRPLVATYCVWEIWSGSDNHLYVNMYHLKKRLLSWTGVE